MVGVVIFNRVDIYERKLVCEKDIINCCALARNGYGIAVGFAGKLHKFQERGKITEAVDIEVAGEDAIRHALKSCGKL